MYRTIITIFLFTLFPIDIANAPIFMNEYEKKLRQIAKENRTFQLPNVLVLQEATFALFGMEYFLEKTRLLEKIADRRLKELTIYMLVDLAFYDYMKYLKDNLPHPTVALTTIPKEMKQLLIDTIIRVSKEVEKEP